MKRDLTQWRRRFAWLPMTTTDHQRIWLEWYEERMQGPKGLDMLYRRVTRVAPKEGR